MLVIDQHLLAPFFSTVIVVGGQLFQIGLEGPVLDPPVEVEQLGAVAVDELAGPQQPIFQIFPVRLWLAEQVVDAALRHGRPVKVAALQRLLDVAVKFFAVAQEEPMLRPV